MQDMVIKGTGNSRFLKSVEDFLDRFPTYEAFAAAFAAGILPVDFNGINPDGITQMGTPFAKSTMLKDSTTALFGLDISAVPADVLDKIIKGFTMMGNLHISRASYPGLKLLNTGANTSGLLEQSDGGVLVLRTCNDENTADNARDLRIYNSDNKNLEAALSFVDVVDGVYRYYTVLHTGNLEALNMARIVTGSYVGTGTYGSNNKNVLNLSIKPRLLIVAGENCMMIASYGVAFGLFFHEVTGTSSNVQVNSVLWGDSTVQWWSTNGTYGPEFQMNTNGKQYHYVAVG